MPRPACPITASHAGVACAGLQQVACRTHAQTTQHGPAASDSFHTGRPLLAASAQGSSNREGFPNLQAPAGRTRAQHARNGSGRACRNVSGQGEETTGPCRRAPARVAGQPRLARQVTRGHVVGVQREHDCIARAQVGAAPVHRVPAHEPAQGGPCCAPGRCSHRRCTCATCFTHSRQDSTRSLRSKP
jgi:hypothetical protein